MSAGPYRVEDHRLWLGDEELLAGPLDLVAHFAAVLNAADPDDGRIAATLRALICATAGDHSFAPGARLLADGTPTRQLTRRGS